MELNVALEAIISVEHRVDHAAKLVQEAQHRVEAELEKTTKEFLGQVQAKAQEHEDQIVSSREQAAKQRAQLHVEQGKNRLSSRRQEAEAVLPEAVNYVLARIWGVEQ